MAIVVAAVVCGLRQPCSRMLLLQLAVLVGYWHGFEFKFNSDNVCKVCYFVDSTQRYILS